MIYSIIMIAILVLIVWKAEPRIFLWAVQRMMFLPRSGKALHLDKQTCFKDSALLEEHWKEIRDELEAVLQKGLKLPKFHTVDAIQKRISFEDGPAWRTILLKGYGSWFDDNCRQFPVTTALIRSCSNVSTAMFSVLEPGTVIPPHTGKLTGIYRYQLALKVPRNGNCALTVNGEEYRWKAGEGILFDDTFLHSVKNETDERRVVLFIDVNKEMPRFADLIQQLSYLVIRISPLFRNAVRKGKVLDF